MQELPSPLSDGWKSYGDTYKAIMTDELPAPIALIRLSVCACKTKSVKIDASVEKTSYNVRTCASVSIVLTVIRKNNSMKKTN